MRWSARVRVSQFRAASILRRQRRPFPVAQGGSTAFEIERAQAVAHLSH